MLFASTLAILIAQSASPSPLSAGWQAVPLEAGETASFARQVDGRPPEKLAAIAQVCDCDPDRVVSAIASKVGTLSGVHIVRSTTVECGRTAQHMVVTGLANGTAQNVDLYAFRTTDKFVILSFNFSKSQPGANDESDLRTLCPAPDASPVPSPSATATT